MAHRDGARDRADRVRHRARHHHSRRQTRARPRSAREGPRAVIGELATLLNNLKPAPEHALPCPMPVATPPLKFTPENKNGRAVVVSVSGCGIDYVTVNGASQLSLWDQDGRLPALTRTLIGS